MAEVILKVRPYARQESEISLLAVALAQANENTNDLAVALRRQHGISRHEGFFVFAGCIQIAFQAALYYRRRHVAASVFQQRYEIIGCMAPQRILEIQQADTR